MKFNNFIKNVTYFNFYIKYQMKEFGGKSYKVLNNILLI